jgi:molybdate transport system substrate-binding protein
VNHFRLVALFLFLVPAVSVAEDQLTIAVASNFQRTAVAIADAFSESSQISVRVIPGSTGKLYAQISNGAPYDIFLAADSDRPRRLEDDGVAIKGSRFTYAIGSLLLWSADTTLKESDCLEVLHSGAYRHLAIANPATAPYGAAAIEFLKAEGVYNETSSRLVYGENIAQAFQFVATGNATLGLIAASQLVAGLSVKTGCQSKVSRDMHSQIAQQAVLLAHSKSTAAAKQFAAFLQGPQAAEILEDHGYEVPE